MIDQQCKYLFGSAILASGVLIYLFFPISNTPSGSLSESVLVSYRTQRENELPVFIEIFRNGSANVFDGTNSYGLRLDDAQMARLRQIIKEGEYLPKRHFRFGPPRTKNNELRIRQKDTTVVIMPTKWLRSLLFDIEHRARDILS